MAVLPASITCRTLSRRGSRAIISPRRSRIERASSAAPPSRANSDAAHHVRSVRGLRIERCLHRQDFRRPPDRRPAPPAWLCRDRWRRPRLRRVRGLTAVSSASTGIVPLLDLQHQRPFHAAAAGQPPAGGEFGRRERVLHFRVTESSLREHARGSRGRCPRRRRGTPTPWAERGFRAMRRAPGRSRPRWQQIDAHQECVPRVAGGGAQVRCGSPRRHFAAARPRCSAARPGGGIPQIRRRLLRERRRA